MSVELLRDSAEPGAQRTFPNFFISLMLADELGAEQGHHGHRNDVRREQRQHDRRRQRDKQKATHAIEEDDWEKYDCRRDRGRKHRQRYLLAALFSRHLGILSHLEMAEY